MNLKTDEIIRIRLAYTKHQRHRVAHEFIAGPGFKLMSLALWIRVVVALRLKHAEPITVDSPLLVRMKKDQIVPMTANFMAQKDKVYCPILKWNKATIHSRRRGFATAAVRSGFTWRP